MKALAQEMLQKNKLLFFATIMFTIEEIFFKPIIIAYSLPYSISIFYFLNGKNISQKKILK